MSIQQVRQKAKAADAMIAQLAADAATAEAVGSEGAIAEHIDTTGDQATAEVIALVPDEPAGTVVPDDVVIPAEIAQDTGEMAKLRSDLEALQHWRSTTEGIVRSKEARIDVLQDIIANMQTVTQPEVATVVAPTVGHTQEDTDAFGSDMIEMVSRVAQAVFASQAGTLTESIVKIEGRLDTVGKQSALSAEDRFRNKLDTLVSDWKVIDSNPAFVAWLQESPARNNLFASSVKSLDHSGVAEVMNQYQTLHGQVEAAAKAVATDTQIKLEAQVAPGKSRKSAPAAKTLPEDKIWTRSEIVTVMNSKSDYTAEEFAALEREIAQAQKDERVDFSR
jgi:hypothetical protein